MYLASFKLASSSKILGYISNIYKLTILVININKFDYSIFFEDYITFKFMETRVFILGHKTNYVYTLWSRDHIMQLLNEYKMVYIAIITGVTIISEKMLSENGK